jgi:hypothetical protein
MTSILVLGISEIVSDAIDPASEVLFSSFFKKMNERRKKSS